MLFGGEQVTSRRCALHVAHVLRQQQAQQHRTQLGVGGRARSVPGFRSAGVARSLPAPWTWRPVGKAATPEGAAIRPAQDAQFFGQCAALRRAIQRAAGHRHTFRRPRRERYGADAYACARLTPVKHRNTLRSATDRPGTTISSTMAARMTPFAAPSGKREGGEDHATGVTLPHVRL